jgi:hypothetical protein
MKKLLKNLMYGGLLALPYGTFAQAFTENFGSVTGTSSIATASVNFANLSFTYTGTADVRNTTPSNTYTLASGTAASGAANIFLTNTVGRVIEISGINTTTLTSPAVNFGISKSTNADNGSGLIVEYAVGTSTVYTALSFPVLPTGSNTSQTNWFARQTVGTIPSTTNLRLRFRQNSSTVQYRIDDVQLGVAAGGGTTTPCSTTATITASGATTLCNGGSVVLTASSAASYTWSTGANTPSISVNQSGTYNVTVTTTGSCTAVAATPVRVLVYPTPIVGGSATNICGSGTSTLTARTFAPDLIISEYVESTGNDKYVEIYNGTGAAIANLSDYVYRAFQNGSTTPITFSLTGLSIADGGVLVLRNPSAAPLAVPTVTTGAVVQNGNDAIGIYKISTASYVDIFGVIGFDPGSAWTGTGGYTTLDKTLSRKSSVYSGITVNPALAGPTGFTTLTTEWDLLPVGTVSGLGSHTMEGTYSWSAGTTPSTGSVVTASPPATNVYNVTGNYAVSGCSNTGTVQVNVFDAPSVVIDNGDVPVITQCYGPQCVNLTALPTGATPFTYAWSTSETTAGIVVCPTVTTSYSVVATDVNGCTAIESISIVVLNTCCEGKKVIVCTGTEVVCADSSAVDGLILAGGYVGPCDTRKFMSRDDDATAVSMQASALNVYPNPFTDATMLEVKLNAASQVKIEIMDITGKKVAELTNSMFAAGTHQFNWNGSNSAGNAVSSGLYFCRIASGDQVQTIKIQKLSDK